MLFHHIRTTLAGALLLAGAAPHAADAQTPADSARRDSSRLVRRDSLRAARLGAVRVTVTRAADDAARAPWAVGVADAREVRRAQPTLGPDEALSTIPGVIVFNRYNWAQDQRIALRGVGARANFGLRGLKVLLDGVPQTLPDGQSQLTNVDLAAVSRAEVLRGAASSLYGNGGGGVLAFTTDVASRAPFEQTARLTSGAWGTRKWQTRTAGRAGRAMGALSLSRTTVDGFRQWSAADTRQGSLGADWALGTATTLGLRAAAAETPRAENPGALTFAEWRANPDSASAFNVRRGADRRVKQRQLALTLRHGDAETRAASVAVFGLTRTVRNALATTPAGGGTGPTSGTYNTIDRGVGGVRADGSLRLGATAAAPLLSAGIDAQRMRDRRRNTRATGGRPTTPTDTLVLDQLETVTSVGPFAQLRWTPTSRLLASAGGRADRVRFAVDDRFTGDGDDDSGARDYTAWTGHAGASFVVAPAFVPYANVSTAFETPTTTELNARPGGAGGFNPDLGPQRTASAELGARGGAGMARWTAALFHARVRDAIVQFADSGGRAFFRNAGRTLNTGAELSLELRPHPLLALEGAYTWSRYTFADYYTQQGATRVSYDGKRVPGVPARWVRTGVRAGPVKGLTLDADHLASSYIWADDANTLRVPGWGHGVLNARMAWSGGRGPLAAEPFVGVLNAFDQRYVGAVTVNGANGRVLEPAPGRNWYAGVEIGWR